MKGGKRDICKRNKWNRIEKKTMGKERRHTRKRRSYKLKGGREVTCMAGTGQRNIDKGKS